MDEYKGPILITLLRNPGLLTKEYWDNFWKVNEGEGLKMLGEVKALKEKYKENRSNE